MPINTAHPEYNKMIPLIEKTRDAFDGEVYNYVPRLSGQSDKDYKVYKQRSSYYNVIERTTLALIGALTRKPYTLENVWMDDPVCTGNEDFSEFIQDCYKDLLLSGRVGILCDYNEEKQSPYLTSYDSCCIHNWSEQYIVLKEHYYQTDPKDQYSVIKACQFRELCFDELGYYQVRIWQQKSGAKVNDPWVVIDTLVPTIRGQRLTSIPFVCINPYEVCCEPVKPVLSTLADINIEHFTISTDIAHGAHFLAIPTPWISGNLNNNQQTIRLGTDEFIQLEQGGQVGFLEFTGQGLGFLRDVLNQKEEYMYNLGSRMLQFKKGVESSDALQIRLGAEGAILATLANTLEEGLEQILDIYNSWAVVTDLEVELSLNKDFSPTNLTPQEMSSLLMLFQKDVISLDTLLKRLYEGEVIDDVEEELEKLTGQEEPGESALEGPNSEEDTKDEELNKYNQYQIIKSKA